MNSDLNLNNLTNIPSTNIDEESMLSMIGGKENKSFLKIQTVGCTLSCTVNRRCL